MGAEGLAEANYRPADGDENCAGCAFFEAGYCSMFETDVDPAYVCDEWTAPVETLTKGDRVNDETRSASEVADLPEFRIAVAPIVGVDVRDPSQNEDGTWTMSGYAAVFDTKTVLYNGKFLRITEDIDPRAFDNVLATQGLDQPNGVVHFNLGHDMNRAIAATDVPMGSPGSLSLSANPNGLFYFARAAKDDLDAVTLASKLRTGVVKQASFMFTVANAQWTDTENANGPDESHRRILEIGHLYDVCACPQGAYSSTVSQLRSYYGAAMGQPEIALAVEGGLHRQPVPGGEDAVSPVGEAAAAKRSEIAAMRRAAASNRKASL